MPKPKAKPTALEPTYSAAHRLDRTIRTGLLVVAKAIRHQLGQARTPADFAACSKDADALWRRATLELHWRGADEMFLSDVCHWLGWGRAPVLGRVEHRYAIKAIKSYIKCLEERIDDPYCKYDEDGEYL